MIYSNPDIALAIPDFLGKGFPIDEFPHAKEECAVLITVNEKHNREIGALLREKGFSHVYAANNWKRTLACIKRAIGIDLAPSEMM
jgi:hypothetical protein